MSGPRDWEQIRADATKALIAAADDYGHDGLLMGDATKLADAVLAVVDEEAVNRMAEVFVEETRIRSMDFRDGATMDLEPSRTLVAYWVGAARAMLGSAPNYSETEIDFGLADPPGVEMTIGAGGGERYVFRVQRRGKLTPHQARQAAEAKLAEVRKLAESLGDRSNEPRDPSLPPGDAGRVSDRRLMEPLRRLLLAILDGTEGDQP